MALVRHDENLWHQRLLLEDCGAGRWVILMADGGIHTESLGAGNIDVSGYDAAGQLYRDWKSVLDILGQSEMKGWPINGPRTSGWVARFMLRRNTVPEDHHRWWQSKARFDATRMNT